MIFIKSINYRTIEDHYFLEHGDHTVNKFGNEVTFLTIDLFKLLAVVN